MNILSVENLTRTFGERVLFENISFGLSKGDKAAIIAANGSGKSTLLNILTGKDNPDSGSVVYREGFKKAYLLQEPEFDPALTIGDLVFSAGNEMLAAIKRYEDALEAQEKDFSDSNQHEFSEALAGMDRLQAWDHERKLKTILTKFEVYQPHQKIGSLSGGQKKRLALALVLLDDPDLIILDEPTNHLDVEMIEWLEKHLQQPSLTVLMVTHDRYFLDRVCNIIYEISDHKIYKHEGNYSTFLENKAEREEIEETEFGKNKQLLKKELEWMRRMPKARTTKSKSRIDAYHDLEDKTQKGPGPGELKLGVKMSRLGNKILELEHVNKAFGDKVIMDDFSYTFRKGERIGIVGKNGTGKSTFLNILTGKAQPDSGSVSAGETVIFGYYTQQGLQLAGNKRVIEVVKDIAEVITSGDGKTMSASQFLTRFMFPPASQYTYVDKLSGGERRRLYLLTVLIKNPNFLILDEPTNDLDILTLNRLEEFLESFPGCLIVVSHDRYFMDKMAGHLLVFNGEGDIKGFTGKYSEFREQLRLDEAEKKSPAPVKTEEKKAIPVKAVVSDNKLSYKEKLELETLEKDIAGLEVKKKTIESQLSTETDYEKLSELSAKAGEVSAQLDEKSMRWLELSERL